jgi:hypothetical protein
VRFKRIGAESAGRRERKPIVHTSDMAEIAGGPEPN